MKNDFFDFFSGCLIIIGIVFFCCGGLNIISIYKDKVNESVLRAAYEKHKIVKMEAVEKAKKKINESEEIWLGQTLEKTKEIKLKDLENRTKYLMINSFEEYEREVLDGIRTDRYKLGFRGFAVGIFFFILGFVDRKHAGWKKIKKLTMIFKYIEKNENRKTMLDEEWIHYRNGISHYQNIIDDRLKTEENFADDSSGAFFNKGVKKLYEGITSLTFEPITPERLKQDKELFAKFLGYYFSYFESAGIGKQKAEEKKKKPATPAEILADKDFKVEILNKDKTIAEADEAIAKIKKRTSALFAKPKKEMTAGEKLRERVRRIQEILKVVDELKEGMPPEQQEMLEAEAYRLTEKIKEWG